MVGLGPSNATAAHNLPVMLPLLSWNGTNSMVHDDAEYYQARAEQELEFAQRSTNEAGARAHYLIAGYYLDRVYSGPNAPEKPAPAWINRTAVP